MRNSFLIVGLLLTIISCNSESYQFAVICDTRSDANNSGKSGVNASGVEAVCRHLNQSGAEFVIAPGDFICGNVDWYKPTPPSNDTQYSAFLEAAKKGGVTLPNGDGIPLYAVRGNHECYQNILPKDSVKSSWIKNIGYSLPKNGPEEEIGFTYSFPYKGSLFIGLDQYMYADSTQKTGLLIDQEWLNQELNKYPKIEHLFTFGHTPVFAANHQDCLGEDSIARNIFLQSINDRSGVYFCGHDHFYARAKVPVYNQYGGIKNYIQQIITPSGAPFLTGSRDDNHKWSGNYKNKDVVKEEYLDNYLGYQLITVEGNNVTIEFIATSDAASYTIDSVGVYHYTYNDNWETWNFEIMDTYSYSLP
ncbi:MAG: metallophosphoesterase [Bacteroidales bacterium]|nr:metallophosphoesterase [Bacteroidales bacterium]